MDSWVNASFVRCVDPHLCDQALADMVLREYGTHIHEAVQGPHARVRYLRKLADALFPYLLPPTALQCKCVCLLLNALLLATRELLLSRTLVGFLRELWSYQLLTMACDTVANPVSAVKFMYSD